MKYQVEYSATAIRDLDRIWNEVFEASKDYDTTQKYLDDLTPLYYEDLFTGYYFVVFKAYMAFYRVEEDRMLVDRVLFAASDYMRCLHLGTDQ